MSTVALYSPPPRRLSQVSQISPADFASMLELLGEAHFLEVESLRAQLAEALGDKQSEQPRSCSKELFAKGIKSKSPRRSASPRKRLAGKALGCGAAREACSYARLPEEKPKLSPDAKAMPRPVTTAKARLATKFEEDTAIPLACETSANDDRSGITWSALLETQVERPVEVTCEDFPLYEGEQRMEMERGSAPPAFKSMNAAKQSETTSCLPVAEEGATSQPESEGLHGEGGSVTNAQSYAFEARASSKGLANDSDGSSWKVARPARKKMTPDLTLSDRLDRRRSIQSKGKLHKFVRGAQFELFFAACITMNCFLIAAEVQFRGYDIGFEIKHHTTPRSTRAMYPWADMTLDVMGLIFGFVFFIELILKVIGLKREFIKDTWNLLDSVIVLIWIFDLATRVFSSGIAFDTSVLRLARLTRLLRVFRIFKFVKAKGFDSLYIMISAVSGSMSILCWTILVLLGVHMFMAMVMSQFLFTFYFHTDGSFADAGELEVYTYFGTFSRSLLTMFEITLANWPPACRLLVENVSEWFIVFSIFLKLSLGFAVIGVINGVLIQETFKVVAENDTIMVNRIERDRNTHAAKMKRLFMLADESEDGFIDQCAFKDICQDKWVKSWLLSQGLDTSDADSLYHMLDDGDGHLTVEELVAGVGKLKGPARSIDLMKLMNNVKALTEKLESAGEA